MFELHITSTKDIDKLKIDFSDGTTVITSNEKSTSNESKNSKQKQRKSTVTKQSEPLETEGFLDTNANYGSVSQEVVEKPVIVTKDRDVKVAEELQNLDI